MKLEEKTERWGRTPLHLVVIGCHDSIIAARRAAKHGTSLAAKSQAIQAKFVRVLAYMLHQGAIVDRQDAGAQSLQAKPAACTLSLLTYCPCSLPPAVGATPVHYAAAFGLQKVLGHLLSADDSDDQLNAEDAGNCSAMRIRMRTHPLLRPRLALLTPRSSTCACAFCAAQRGTRPCTTHTPTSKLALCRPSKIATLTAACETPRDKCQWTRRETARSERSARRGTQGRET